MRSPRTRFSSSCSDCWKGQFAPARVHRRPTDHCSSMERPPAHPKMKPSANCSRSVSTSTRTNWLGGSGERVLPESCLPIRSEERRVGKEGVSTGRYGLSPDHEKKKKK